MTRKEKEQRIQKQDGKVFENFSVEIRPTYLNPTYTLSDQTANEISPTGLLKVFELNSSGDGPSFTARWDGGNRSGGSERYELDMDIHGVSDQERIRFKHGLGGYSGHHTTCLLYTSTLSPPAKSSAIGSAARSRATRAIWLT